MPTGKSGLELSNADAVGTVLAGKSGIELSNTDAVGSDQLFGWTGAAERLPARPAQPADFQQAERGTTYSL